MIGIEAKLAFDKANALVKEGRYDEALLVEMLPSDLEVIEDRIAAAKNANCANTAKERM